MNIRFYIDPETDLPHIYEHGVTEETEMKKSAPAPKPKNRKTQQVFPSGWDEKRVRELIAFYENHGRRASRRA